MRYKKIIQELQIYERTNHPLNYHAFLQQVPQKLSGACRITLPTKVN